MCMYRSVAILTMALGIAVPITGESRGPIGPKLCVELCNQKGDCKAAFYDSQNLVCHFKEPKPSDRKEHITKLMTRWSEKMGKEQNGILIQTRNKGPKIVPVTKEQIPRPVHVPTEAELKDKGYKKITDFKTTLVKVYSKCQSWLVASAICKADGASLIKVSTNRRKIDIHFGLPAKVTWQKYLWVGLSYSTDRGEFLWMDGTPGGKFLWMDDTPGIHDKLTRPKKHSCGTISVKGITVIGCNATCPFICAFEQ